MSSPPPACSPACSPPRTIASPRPTPGTAPCCRTASVTRAATRGDTRQAVPALRARDPLAPGVRRAPRCRGAGSSSSSRRATTRRDVTRSLAHLAGDRRATGALPDLVDVGRRAAPARPRRCRPRHARGRDRVWPHRRRPPDRVPPIHKPYTMRDDEPYRASAVDGDGRALIADTRGLAARRDRRDARGGRAADVARPRGGLRALRRRRCPPRAGVAHASAVSMFSRLTTVLGAGAIMLYERDEAPDVTVVAAGTPVIVLGPAARRRGRQGPARRPPRAARARRRADPARAPRVRGAARTRRDPAARLGRATVRPAALRDSVSAHWSPRRTSSTLTTRWSRARCRSSCGRGSSSCSRPCPPPPSTTRDYLAACERMPTAPRCSSVATPT